MTMTISTTVTRTSIRCLLCHHRFPVQPISWLMMLYIDNEYQKVAIHSHIETWKVNARNKIQNLYLCSFSTNCTA